MRHRRTRRVTLLAAGLVWATVGAACSASSDAPAAPPGDDQPAAEVLAEADLSGRDFWWGDARGSLFEVHLDHAQVRVEGGATELRVTGSAQNLSPSAARLELSGSASAGGPERTFSGGAGDPVQPDGRSPVVVTVADVDPELDPTAMRLVLGGEGTNQVLIPLGSGAVETGPAPQHAVVPESSIEFAPDATLTVTGSTLYPRYESGRAGQYRLQVLVTVEVAGGSPDQVLMLHPSLTDPEGNEASLGDQVAIDAQTHFVEGAVLNELVPGTYELTVLEVATDASASLAFDLG